MLKKVNDISYKIYLLGEYNVSTTFNVRPLSTFLEDEEDSDLRENPIQLGEDDVIHGDIGAAKIVWFLVLGQLLVPGQKIFKQPWNCF